MKSVFTKHETVNHQDGYVSKTGVNTNQIESVWKHIRRTFKTHIKVAKHHIHLYAKEAAYKFNNIPSFETVMLCLIKNVGRSPLKNMQLIKKLDSIEKWENVDKTIIDLWNKHFNSKIQPIEKQE